jgi:predicted dithiol-disulfide oxidoreductase (DUF899 family)
MGVEREASVRVWRSEVGGGCVCMSGTTSGYRPTDSIAKPMPIRRRQATGSVDPGLGVREWHGTNAFIREDDRIFRTYFIDSRGDEALGTTWSYLAITALGRQEEWEDSPEGYPQTPPYGWCNYHDAYGAA